MNYKIDHIPISKDKRQGVKITPKYITIHSTANPTSTAQNERNWLVNLSNTRQASWHVAVDEKSAVEAIPLDEKALHAGDTKGNIESIGIEICESGNRQKTIQNTVELVAKLLYERNWGTDKLRRHYDWSGKNCPRILNYNNWEGWTKFKNDAQKELDKLTKQDSNKEQTISPWARDAWAWGIKQGVTDGNRPKDTATREEIITMLYRMSKVK